MQEWPWIVFGLLSYCNHISRYSAVEQRTPKMWRNMLQKRTEGLSASQSLRSVSDSGVCATIITFTARLS